jgi:site-specific DNA-cytosine methylase
MNNLTYLPLLEEYIVQNGAASKFNVPFLSRKNKFNVELQNWKDYQAVRKGIITIRQSGIRVSNIYPCLTHLPNIPIIYENDNYRYLNKEELLSLQSFPTNYQFPKNYSLTKIAAWLGNSINLNCLEYFLKNKFLTNLNFVDLFCGIGGFHLVMKRKDVFYPRNNCLLAVDINKNSQETYQLNFPNTPFLLGDINNKEIQKKIISTDFDLLCAGFPCQPFSKANGLNKGESQELSSLLKIIQKKKPQYLLLENVPNFLLVGSSKFLLSLLKNYHLQISILNPLELGIKQHRPRLFLWGQLKNNF